MASKKMTPRMAAIVVALFAGVAATPEAEAATITFDQVVQGGTITYGTVGGALVGTDILFDFLTAAGTGADGIYACSSCSLDFTSGTAFGDTDGPIYTFGGGGSFVLTGGIPVMGIAAGSTLLSGTWSASPTSVAVAAGSTITFSGIGTDEKHADLAAFLGIDPTTWQFASSEFSLGAATVNPDGTFSGSITQADLQNRDVPEPGALALLGLGLGLAGFISRRRQRAG